MMMLLTLTPRRAAIGMAIIALIVVCGCQKKSNDDEDVGPNTPEGVVIPKTSEEGVIDLRVTERSDGILVEIKNVPEGASLDCFMNDERLTPCHDGALIQKPAPGSYMIKVVAHSDKGSFSDIDMIDIGIPHLNSGNSVPAGQKDTLQIVVDDQRFVQGMAMDVAKFFMPKVKFRDAPDCKYTVECNITGGNEQWKSCALGTDERMKLYSGVTLAYGYQDFAIRAVCGDRIGPQLIVAWYGVPASYQKLSIQDISDNKGRHMFALYRDLDCADNLIFQCAKSSADDFSACANGNLIDNPPSGYRVRAICGNEVGPEMKIQ